MSDQTNPVLGKNKLELLNIIKALIIFPGITYHVSEYVNFPEPLIDDHWFVSLFTTYARIFYYTAFVATLAVFYPFGMKLSQKIFNLKRSLIAFSGLIFLSYIYYDPESPFFNTEWTFYHFVVSSFIVLHFLLPLLKNSKMNVFVLCISVLILWIPFWNFDYPFLSYALKIALVGDCKYTSYGEWPLLPWIFLCTLAVSFCVLLENNMRFKKISIVESSIWLIAIFALGIPFWGAYFDQPTDTHFSCGVFARPQYVFYAHILPYFFLIRLNYVESIRLKLQNNNFLKKLSSFSWINNFGTCYLLSLLTMGILSLIYDGDMFAPGMKHFMFMLSIFITFLVPEFLTRALKSMKKN